MNEIGTHVMINNGLSEMAANAVELVVDDKTGIAYAVYLSSETTFGESSELVNLCRERLGWKPTTTYTVIKRLSERGVLKNENTVVTSLVSKDEVQAAEINEMVEKTFEGSLPAFIAAFTKHRKISEKELDEVQAMIDRYRKGE